METNWKNENGFDIQGYDLAINTINSSKTRIEQQMKIEKISLVSFLNQDQRTTFVNICRHLKHNNDNFYQNKNLHATLFGFGPLEKEIYERIREKIHQFLKHNEAKKMNINFECVRPGAMYSEGKVLKPLEKIGNGTVIAFGGVDQNQDFCNFSNNLTLFLLRDKKIKSKLGANFRRKFPTVWCTLGYYDMKENFQIGKGLENIFKQYDNLKINGLKFPISEISLVKSKYKNLRYPKILQKFRL